MIAARVVTGGDEIDRISPPSAESFRRRYVDRSRPVIIVGATDDWPARRLWSADYLTTRFGHHRVPVADVVDGRVTDDPATGFVHRDQPLGDCIERLRAPRPADGYAMFPVSETLPELAGDLRVPAFVPRAPWSMHRFWLSARETTTPLHMDLPENVLAQLIGRKRVTLFSPREEWRRYRNRPWSRLPHMSPIDAESPDLTRFPRFAKARPLRCVIEPGELLYIPRFWWHQVRSLEFSVSVNYWWASGWVWKVVRAALAYQRLRKLRY